MNNICASPWHLGFLFSEPLITNVSCPGGIYGPVQYDVYLFCRAGTTFYSDNPESNDVYAQLLRPYLPLLESFKTNYNEHLQMDDSLAKADGVAEYAALPMHVETKILECTCKTSKCFDLFQVPKY